MVLDFEHKLLVFENNSGIGLFGGLSATGVQKFFTFRQQQNSNKNTFKSRLKIQSKNYLLFKHQVKHFYFKNNARD